MILTSPPDVGPCRCCEVRALAVHAINEIDAKKLGATLVVNEEQRLTGIITDGDLRRALLENDNIQNMRVDQIMSASPKTIDEDQTAAEALGVMEFNGIMHLAIVDRRNQIKGIVHLHDLLGREEFKINGGSKPSTGAHR